MADCGLPFNVETLSSDPGALFACGIQRKGKTRKMSELIKNKGCLCVHPLLSPPHPVETENPHVAKRHNSQSEPNPLYKSTKTFDTQFQTKDPFFTIERIFQKGLFHNTFIQIHGYQVILKR